MKLIKPLLVVNGHNCIIIGEFNEHKINLYTRCISLNPLFFSQKNTLFFFLGSKNKFIQIYSNLFKVLAIANYTFSPSFGQFVYITPKKFLIF